MTAEEYLNKCILDKYKPCPGCLIRPIPKDTIVPFIVNNKFYCTGKYNIGDKWWGFFTDYNTDGCIIKELPNSVQVRQNHPEVYLITKWIDKNLFKFMLENAEMPQAKTELVHLRIAVNMILKLEYLSKEDKDVWVNWIQELYWSRKRVLHQWYLEYVLPF